MSKAALVLALLAIVATGAPHAQDATDPKVQELRSKIRALGWVYGPKSIPIAGNSTLSLPDGYVYLDASNTAKFEELNQNLSGGKEVMIAPKSLQWIAYLLFEDEGYVKDDEKIDAKAILKSLTDNTEAGNEERRRRGWPDLHVVGWSIPPAYNSTTKRLEWATVLRSQNGEGINFFTKVLGRKGFTTVVLVSSTENLTDSVTDLNGVLADYRFNSGESYADWRPGDKVAEYGLTGLIVGGAVAAAVKTGLFKGLWKALIAGAAAMWKVLAVGAAAIVAWLRSFFRRKQT
jgi:uncharacterized membrane-anchored protein